MEEITLILTVASIVVPVLATLYSTLYTVMSRVKAEHKPYIILHKIEPLSKLDKCLYFIVLIGNKIKKKYLDDNSNDDLDEEKSIDVMIKLKNIGYGVATNVKFYDLYTGKKIYGNQEIDDVQIQKLFTTFDIGAGEEKSVQTSFVTKVTEDGVVEDTTKILCVYQDLNYNVYDFLFVVNIKKGGGYNYFAYQPSSKSYTKLMKKYKKERRKILFDYKK